MANFNASNPDQLIYSNTILTIEVLRGVRLEGLDRMRGTLKVELKRAPCPPAAAGVRPGAVANVPQNHL